MKILRVITSMDPASGGPCQGLRNLCPELEKLGVSNEVVCLDEPGDPHLTGGLVKCHALGRPRGSWARHPNLRHWLDERLAKYDAVVCHGLWQYPAVATAGAVAAARRRNPDSAPRFFVMPHGMLDPWFQRDPSRRIKAIRNTLYWHVIERRNVSRADAVLFTCRRELELARETFWRYRPNQEINVGYGIPAPPPLGRVPSQGFRDLVPRLEGNPYLLYLSRIHPKKGVDLLVDAYRALADAGTPTAGIPDLVIAGPNDNTYARQMMDRAAGISTVHFPGMLQGDAKWAALHGCEAFILPSHQENFGVAVVEALACGKPVLISDQVNIHAEITASGAGLAEPDNLLGAKALLARWVGLETTQRRQMAQDALACYQAKFAAAAAGREFARVIRSFLDTKSSD